MVKVSQRVDGEREATLAVWQGFETPLTLFLAPEASNVMLCL